MAKENRTSVYFDRETLQFVGLDVVQMQQLKDTYKGVNVDVEFKKMVLWLTSSKGMKRKGNIGFILNWLNNASPQGTVSPTTEQFDLWNEDSPLRPLMENYLRDLWKGREHILELNKRKRKS